MLRVRGGRYASLASLRAAAFHTHEHTSRSRGTIQAQLQKILRRGLLAFSTVSDSVWGRVVSDIPAFCRELVAALAEE